MERHADKARKKSDGNSTRGTQTCEEHTCHTITLVRHVQEMLPLRTWDRRAGIVCVCVWGGGWVCGGVRLCVGEMDPRLTQGVGLGRCRLHGTDSAKVTMPVLEHGISSVRCTHGAHTRKTTPCVYVNALRHQVSGQWAVAGSVSAGFPSPRFCQNFIRFVCSNS